MGAPVSSAEWVQTFFEDVRTFIGLCGLTAPIRLATESELSAFRQQAQDRITAAVIIDECVAMGVYASQVPNRLVWHLFALARHEQSSEWFSESLPEDYTSFRAAFLATMGLLLADRVDDKQPSTVEGSHE